jgi:hypothetical protein
MDIEDLRLAVFDLFVAGRTPTSTTLADRLGVPRERVLAGLAELATQRHLAIDAAGEVTMAHPFTATPLGFSVMAADRLWWGGCAWDSFAIPHLVPSAAPVLVATECPACATPHAWKVDRDAPPPGDQVAHFLVPAARMWDDVLVTCGNQRLFCSADCVDRWLAATGNECGSVIDLATLWRLAEGWYAGRLDRGYTRREPSTAAGYLRGVGLSGAFWGL